jgi:hypothetical protein
LILSFDVLQHIGIFFSYYKGLIGEFKKKSTTQNKSIYAGIMKLNISVFFEASRKELL